MDIHLELWEINLVLNILAEKPYNEVAGIIRNITEQVEKQKEVTYSTDISIG